MRDWACAAVGLLLCRAVCAAPEARLSLSALDHKLRPVPGVSVSLECQFEPVVILDDDRWETDAGGRFVVDHLPPGPYRVHLLGPLAHDWASGTVDLAAGDNKLEALLWPREETQAAATLEVLVIGRDGRPAARTEVEVDVDTVGRWSPPAPEALRAAWPGQVFGSAEGCHQRAVLTTDDAGRLRLTAPPGRLCVTVTARREQDTGQRVWAPPGRTTWLRARLADGRSTQRAGREPAKPQVKLRGRVVDGEGRPLARLRVVLRSAGDSGDADRQRFAIALYPAAWMPRVRPGVVTDDGGWFEADVTRLGHELCVKAAGWCTSEAEDLDAEKPEPVVFRLTQRARTVRGRVTDAAGHPVPGAVAWAEPLGRDENTEAPLLALDASVPPVAGIPGLLPGGVFAVPCDAAGRFVFDQLDVVRYRFRAWSRGWGLPTAICRAPDEQPGAEMVLKLTRLAALTGLALRPDGSPWPGAPLTVAAGEVRGSAGFNADRDGRWCLTDLTPGRHRILVALPGCLDQVAQVDLRGGEIAEWRQPTQAGHVLTGRVLLADGSPLALARVYCPLPRAMPRVAWTDADGRFRLTGLPAGDRQLDISGPGGTDAPGYAKLPRSQPLEIRLPRHASLSGRLVAPSGRPVGNQRCAFERPGRDDNDGVDLVTDSEGRFALAGLVPGTWRLSVQPDDYDPFEAQIRLAPGEQRTGFTARLAAPRPAPKPPPTATVRGRVVYADGTPAEGVTLSCGGFGRAAKTDARGAFRATVPAGAVRVCVSERHLSAGDVQREVKADTIVELPDVRLHQRLVSGRLLQVPAGVRPEHCELRAGLLALTAAGAEVPHREACLQPALPIEGARERSRATGSGAREQMPIAPGDFGYLLFPTAKSVGFGWPLQTPSMPDAPTARADGTFRIPLPPGRLRLVVGTAHPRGGDGCWLALGEAAADVPATGPVQIDIPLALGTAVLTGRVPVARRQPYDTPDHLSSLVVAYRPGSWSPSAAAGLLPDGSWRLSGLVAGEYRVAWGTCFAGARFATVTARAGETTTVAFVSATHTLRGRLRTRPARPVQLTVESEAAVAAVLVGADGAFAVPDLPAGVYRCTLWGGLGSKLVRLPGEHKVPGPAVELGP